MNKTKIEWVKNPDGSLGYSWNPLTGCLNHVNGMCKGGGFPCYAYKLANGRVKNIYLANKHILGGYTLARGVLKEDAIPPKLDPFYPRFWEDRLWDMHQARGSKGIFVCDMSDLFGIGIPEEWTRSVFKVIVAAPWNRYYLLTKQPQNLIKFSPFPDNCWVGQTLTNQDDADRTFNGFAKVEATVKYLSLEPLLGKIDVSPYLKGWVNAGTIFENPEGVERYDVDGALVNHIDQVIIGAFTGSWKEVVVMATKYSGTPMRYGNKWALQPPIKYVKEIVEACDKAGVKVFLKENLEPLIQEVGMGKARWAAREWVKCKYPVLRQEMPK